MREEWKLGHYLKDVSSAPYQTPEKNNSYKCMFWSAGQRNMVSHVRFWIIKHIAHIFSKI